MRGDLQQLTAAIEAIERRNGGRVSSNGSKRAACLPTNWRDVDQTLSGGGLQSGAVHEWFQSADFFKAQGLPSLGFARHGWFPPLAIFIHLAWQTIDHSRDSDADDGSRLVIWIGRRCWPHVRAMVRSTFTEERFTSTSRFGRRASSPPAARAERAHDRDLLEHSLFIDPPDDAARLWAIDLSLRSLAGSVVIADGSRLDMPATRRLQLAAEAGRSIALLARPSHELSELSAATTRWMVRPTVFHHRDTEAQRRDEMRNDASDPSPLKGIQSHSSHSSLRPLRLCGESSPRWIVQLLRCKGLRPSSGSASDNFFGSAFRYATALHTWAVEWNSAQGCITQLADVVDRPDSQALATRAERDEFIDESRLTAIAARRSA